jgi:DeoR family transcriptional regulator, fructose operon transcriptional repressor
MTGMYAVERQQAIAELVAQRGRQSVNELADRYGVTTETVRRDLDVLERAALITRVHGGAVRFESVTALELALSDRAREHTAEKDRIAKLALDYLPTANGTVIVDAGSSTSRLVTMLPGDRPLRVLTNSVPIAARLAGSQHVTLHVLPGRVRSTTQAAVGDDLVAALAALRADVAFMGTNGISLGHGFSTPDPDEAAAKRAMIASAHQVVVLADSTKFGAESTVRFATFDDVDVVITDDGADENDVKALRDAGVEIVLA